MGRQWPGLVRDHARLGAPCAVAHAGLGGARAAEAGRGGSARGPHDAAFEVRAFTGLGTEDPVTGSLNASLAQWLIGAGLAASSYVAAQGTALQRAGRVHLRKEGDDIWVGGDVVSVVSGELSL
jgi:predicted PhzF superfamily epimerase YddE/YHI9